MRRTWASLFATGALVCGCGGAEPSRPAPAHHADPLAAMDADHAVGQATLCMDDPLHIETRALARFDRTHRAAGLRARELELKRPRSVREEARYAQLAAASGRCDVMVLGSADLGALRGELEDLTPYARARAAEFFAGALATGAAEGRQLAIPQGVSVGMLFRRAGLPAPATWEALYTDRRPSHAVMQAGDNSGAAAVAFQQLLYAAGGSLLGPDGRATVAGPAGRRALGLLVRGFAGGTVTPSLDENISEVSAKFEHGQGGFLPAVSAFAPVMARVRGVRAAQLPHFAGQPPRPLVEGLVVAVPRRAPHRRAALALLDWLTQPAAMPFLLAYRMAPPLKASYADPAMRRRVPAAGAVEVALRHAVPYAVLPKTAAMLYGMDRAVHAAVAGDMSVGQALRQLARDINAILASRGATT